MIIAMILLMCTAIAFLDAHINDPSWFSVVLWSAVMVTEGHVFLTYPGTPMSLAALVTTALAFATVMENVRGFRTRKEPRD